MEKYPPFPLPFPPISHSSNQTVPNLEAISPAHVVSTFWIPKRYHECSSNQPDNVHLPRPHEHRSEVTILGCGPSFFGGAFWVDFFLVNVEVHFLTFSPKNIQNPTPPGSSVSTRDPHNLGVLFVNLWKGVKKVTIFWAFLKGHGWKKLGEVGFLPSHHFFSCFLWTEFPGSLKRHTYFLRCGPLSELTPIFLFSRRCCLTYFSEVCI